jgi:curved DNA-binding protein CbpA
MLRRSRLVAVAGASVKTGRRASTIDVYGILGIDKDADDAAIRRAYKKTSLKAHPDRGGRTSIFQKVKKAHDVLSDEQARRDYDAQADSVDFEKALHLLKNAARPLAISLIRPVGL